MLKCSCAAHAVNTNGNFSSLLTLQRFIQFAWFAQILEELEAEYAPKGRGVSSLSQSVGSNLTRCIHLHVALELILCCILAALLQPNSLPWSAGCLMGWHVHHSNVIAQLLAHSDLMRCKSLKCISCNQYSSLVAAGWRCRRRRPSRSAQTRWTQWMH